MYLCLLLLGLSEKDVKIKTPPALDNTRHDKTKNTMNTTRWKINTRTNREGPEAVPLKTKRENDRGATQRSGSSLGSRTGRRPSSK